MTPNPDVIAVLDRFIGERWGGSFTSKTYAYIASYVTREVPFEGRTLLDIGCGNGLQLAANAAYCSPRLAVGVDNYQGEGSPKTDRDFVGRLRAGLGLGNLAYVIGDAVELPFLPGSFDVIYISHCLHHVYESEMPVSQAASGALKPLRTLLETARKLLRDDGVLVVAEVPRYNLLRLLRPLGFLKSTDFATKQEPHEWMLALRESGYGRFSLSFHTPYPLRLLRPLLSSRFGRFLVSGQYYIIARKA